MWENSKVLNEFFVLDLNNYSWTKSNNLITGDTLPPLCSHGMAAVWPHELNQNAKYTMFNHPEFITDIAGSRKVKIGIYIYGGLTAAINGDVVSDEL